MPLERNLQAAAARFEQGLDDLAARISRREHEEIDEFKDLDAPELWEVNRRITREGRLNQAISLRRGMLLPASCPEADAEAARFAGGGGTSLATVLQAYRIGHALSWDAWLNAVESLDISEPARKECLKAITRFVVAYDDRIMNLVAAEFEQAQEAARISPAKKRLKLIRDLIDGSAQSLNGLDYDLDLEHLGVIAWGPDAQAALHELASTLDRRLIWAPAEDDLLMAWLGSASPFSDEGKRALRDFRAMGDGQLAVGTPAMGLEGFRRSHREAGEAHVVARRHPQPLTLYDDVALEAFALRDEMAAREFVAHALRGLRGGDKRSGDLCHTLRAYFAAGQNAASAAAALGVHEHTVTRHIRKVEETLGCPVNARRAELELALRLERLLP